MLTFVFVNGKKLTVDKATVVWYMNEQCALPEINGTIMINWQNVMFIRQATKEEIEYAKIHGEV